MSEILYLLAIPFMTGVVAIFLPKKVRPAIETVGILGSVGSLAYVTYVYVNLVSYTSSWWRIDGLSRFILLFCGVFGFLIALYSLKFMRRFDRLNEYYGYLLFTIGASFGAVLANNMILLVGFWGFLAFTLFMLITIGGPDRTGVSEAAKKTLIIVGGSDCLMILGVVILGLLGNSLRMDSMNVSVGTSRLAALAFVLLAVTSFAKAGAMPMHTWIPDCAEFAPISVTAFLPASVDKLLGIYLLARLVMDIFVLNTAMKIFLLAVGAFTVLAAVMMALIQHDAKRLLSYHAVSQVGYMVLGIGTCNPIGIAGGLFHMLNHAIYKGCLFLTAGGVEHRTGTTHLDRLGGLAHFMPITFVSFLVAALAISGVPPLNGFASKWLVYQGLIILSNEGGKLWIIWLVAAMFGSALTLASFMKLGHAIFLGQTPDYERATGYKVREVHWSMWLPMVVLAGLCLAFGIFAFRLPLAKFIYPAVGKVLIPGFWQPTLATILILVGIVVGFIIYLMGRIKIREDAVPFIGGEVLPEEVRVTGTDFYDTIREMSILRTIYSKAEQKLFDIYELGKRAFLFLARGVSYAHVGVLTSYVAWIFLGLMAILFVVVRLR